MVLLEWEHPRFWIVARKLDEHARIGAEPCENCLFWIPHDREIAMLLDDPGQQHELRALSATADVTRGCINRGSQGQQPKGLQRSFTTTTGSQTFNTRAGRGSFNVSTTPVTVTGFACPDQMTPVIVSVTFTDVTLTVTSQTGTTTATFPDIDP